MKAQKCFIRKNTPELREKLKSFGIHICPCALFEDWDWLSISECGCHGIGKSGDFGEDIRDIFLYEDTGYIDCGENEELFLAISAMQDGNPIRGEWYCNINKKELQIVEWVDSETIQL